MRSHSDWLSALTRHASDRPRAIAAAEVSADGTIARSISFAALLTSIHQRAHTIAAHTKPQQRILCALPSGIELIEWFAASLLAGSQLVLMHPRSGPGECASIFARTNAAAALADDTLVTRLTPRPLLLNQVATPQTTTPFTPSTAPGGIILGSSGTVGLPKLVRREWPALDADARAVARGFGLTTVDIVLCVPPLCHSYGVDILLGTLFAGATLRIMHEFDAPGAAAQLRRDITILPGIPFIYESLARLDPCPLESPLAPPFNVRVAVSAGSPLAARVRDEFTRLWHIPIGQLYGATELGTVSLELPTTPEFDALAIGRPLPEVSFRIVDVNDPARTLRAGEEGQLAVHAPSMLSGYVDDTMHLVDGHLLTGDLARIDTSGRATITGRLKLLIDTGGFKVNPLEVEAMLLEHPLVAECAVVPMALSDTIHRPLAFIVPRDLHQTPTDADLRRFLRDRLAPTKIPRSFEIVASLPRSPMGKLLRDQLMKERS